MDGSATLTIDTSSTTMNCARQASARMSPSLTRGRAPPACSLTPVPGVSATRCSVGSAIGRALLSGHVADVPCYQVRVVRGRYLGWSRQLYITHVYHEAWVT